MCLYPTLIKNKKYLPNEKNNYQPPRLEDVRQEFVPVGCGVCIECRKQRADGWRLRLRHEFDTKEIPTAFVTLTYSDQGFDELIKDCGVDEVGAIATLSLKRYIDLIRKTFERKYNIHERPKYWFITELGQTSTERLHLHGLFFTQTDKIDEIMKLWKYGRTDNKYCDMNVCEYLLKYITKQDKEHSDFIPRIYASRGIGLGMRETAQVTLCEYNGTNTREHIIDNKGVPHNLPIYIRNKIYSEEQRAMLWSYKLDKQIKYVRGKKIDVSTYEGMLYHESVLKAAQQFNESLGYANGYITDWKGKGYNVRNSQQDKERLMFNRLKKKGADDNVIERAKQRYEQWKKNNELLNNLK